MVVNICPRCQQRYSVESNTVDVIHECNSQSATLDNEDVVVVGDWVDYTGSGTPAGNVMMQGIENELFGTRADLEGEDFEELTNRGRSKKTHRTRQHLEFIKLKGGC